MHVVLVHHAYTLGGGMETYLRDLVSGFLGRGDTVTVLVRKADHALPRPERLRVEVLADGAWPSWLKKKLFGRRVRARLRTHPADLVFTLARVPVAGAVAVCGGTHAGYTAARGGLRWPRDLAETAVERRCYADARLVIAHSRMLADELRDHYRLPAERVAVVYPPVDTRRFNYSLKRDARAWRRAFSLPEDKRLLLFPSSGHKRKGLPLLCAMVRSGALPNTEIVVAGAHPPEGADGQLVRYVGLVKEVERLYAACDLTVMPSRYEPFGLVYPESVLCGTPCVVPRSAGAAEIMTGDVAVVVDELAPAAWAQGIEQAARLQISAEAAERLASRLALPAHIETLVESAARAG